MNWAGQCVLVTGGTRGIGRALVLGLLARGAKVWATGRSDASVGQAAFEVPSANWLMCDLVDPAARTRLTTLVEQASINIVIHNAGIQALRDFTAAPADEAASHADEIDINLLAPIDISREVLPLLRRQPAAALVFITSGLALAPKRSSPVYCATKAGLRFFAKALRAQMRTQGWPVRIVEALPPIVDTDMTRGRGSRKMTPDAAASQILDGVAQGRDEIYVGASRLLKLLLRLSPALGERIMINR
jgi:uncharacterized oxidoreductase